MITRILRWYLPQPKSSPLDTVLTKPVAPPAPPLYTCAQPRWQIARIHQGPCAHSCNCDRDRLALYSRTHTGSKYVSIPHQLRPASAPSHASGASCPPGTATGSKRVLRPRPARWRLISIAIVRRTMVKYSHSECVPIVCIPNWRRCSRPGGGTPKVRIATVSTP